MDLIHKVLENYNLTNEELNGNLLMHGILMNRNIKNSLSNYKFENNESFDTAEKVINSILEKGILYGYSSGNRILGTAAIMNKENDVEESLRKYHYSNIQVLIHIPFAIEDFYIGDFKKEYRPGMGKNTAAFTLDYLNLDRIPKEFIVGVFEYSSQEGKQIPTKFYPNPYYIGDKINGRENIANLKEFLLKHINNNSSIKSITDLNIEIRKYDKNDNFLPIKLIADERYRRGFIKDNDNTPSNDYIKFADQRHIYEKWKNLNIKKAPKYLENNNLKELIEESSEDQSNFLDNDEVLTQ